MQDDKKYKTIYVDNGDQQDDKINIREIFEKYSYHYKWFLLGLLIALVFAFVYLRYATYQYEVSSTILIDNKENGGGSASELSAFQDLGLLSSSKTSLDTEMGILKSRSLMERVINDLGFQVSYYSKGRVGNNEIYMDSLPFQIDLMVNDSILSKLKTSFSITPNSSTKFILTDSKGETKEGTFGKRINSKFGDITVTPRDINNVRIGKEIKVVINPLDVVAINYAKRVTIAAESKKSNLLILTLKDPLKIKAQTILDNLISQYNRDAIEDNNAIARSTNTFLNNRIDDISEELTQIDKGEETYKVKNRLSDMQSQVGIVLQSNAALDNQIAELSSKIKLVDYVTDYMKTNKGGLLPTNLGQITASANQNTLEYNRLILERNRMLKGTTKKNPVIVNKNEQIEQLRASIDQGLRNLRSSLTISFNETNRQKGRLTSQISSAPKIEREIRDIKRHQQIVETLYLYLLEKREENSITLAVTVPIAKVIDRAYGSDIPVSPSKKIVYLATGLLGLFVPFVIIFIRSLVDNKLHTREEVEKLVKAPILGDIPNSKSGKKIIISEDNRSNIAEAFRLLRTNIDFMLPQSENKGKTILVTSTIAGEGKSFIAINLATGMALLNKKVLLIGADIRKPKIATYLNMKKEKGLTHFLVDKSLKMSDVIVHHESTNLDILDTGYIPPNPSELLTKSRFDEVIAYGKANYDFVVVDTAPVNVVTDTLLMSHFADMFIYVIRVGYLDKRLLKTPKMMLENNRLPNMAILINDINHKRKGYGYGYGYEEENTGKLPFWQSLMAKL